MVFFFSLDADAILTKQRSFVKLVPCVPFRRRAFLLGIVTKSNFFPFRTSRKIVQDLQEVFCLFQIILTVGDFLSVFFRPYAQVSPCGKTQKPRLAAGL